MGQPEYTPFEILASFAERKPTAKDRKLSLNEVWESLTKNLDKLEAERRNLEDLKRKRESIKGLPF